MAAAAAIIIMLMIIAPSISAKNLRERVVEFHLGCMNNSNNSDGEEYFNVCVWAFREIKGRYMGTGRILDEYVEALKIYNNYNDTEVDFAVCNLDYSRCPPHIKARLPPDEWPQDDYLDDRYNYDYDGLPLK